MPPENITQCYISEDTKISLGKIFDNPIKLDELYPTMSEFFNHYDFMFTIKPDIQIDEQLEDVFHDIEQW